MCMCVLEMVNASKSCDFVKFKSHDAVECQKFHIKAECRDCVSFLFVCISLEARNVCKKCSTYLLSSKFVRSFERTFAFNVYVRILNFVYATSLLLPK